MAHRLLIATTLAVLATFDATASASAAKGPDAAEVSLGMFLVAVGAMAVLFVLYAIRAALGGSRMPPPEEPQAGDHH